MPSIAGFIQSLLSEDMYATGMLEKMDDRISQLNAGQLRLLVRFTESKVTGLTNKTVLDSYTKLLRKANVETMKRHEEEVRGERERLSRLKAAHAGVNAKAWDTSHASLDRELAKFQKFLKSKARRVAEEEVLQEEMDELHSLLAALPARRVAADAKRNAWWAFGAFLVVVVGPILVLSLLPMGIWIDVAAFLGVCALAAVCWFVGVLRGIVVVPTLDDDDIEDKTRKRAQQTLKGYRAEVRRTFEATEKIFAADIKWRDDWVEGRKQERRNERRKARGASERAAAEEEEEEEEEEAAGGQQQHQQQKQKQREGSCSLQNDGGITFPEGGGGSGRGSSSSSSIEKTVLKKRDRCSSGRVLPDEGGSIGGGGIALTQREEESLSFGTGGGGSGDSNAERHCRPEVDERATDGEEKGLSMAMPMENSERQAPESDPGNLKDEANVDNTGSCERGEAARKLSAPKLLSSEENGGSEGTSRDDTSNDSALDRMRGPCQGSGLLVKSRQGLEEKDHQ
ncbi:unnamed protein product, partial [Pylaiella littoralis]